MATRKPKTRTSRVVEMAELLGVSEQSIRNWMREPDWPGGSDGSVALDDLSIWRYRRDSGQAIDSEVYAGADSPNLERFRAARASQEELKLQAMQGNYLPVDGVHQMCGELASVIRGAGERLQRQCGSEAAEILEEALSEYARRIEERLNDCTGGTQSDSGSDVAQAE